MTYKKQSMKFREVVPTSDMTDEEREARWALWRAGDLSWKLKGAQLDIYNDLVNQDKDVSVILASRRIGKCLSKSTKIPTVSRGFVNIEDLIVGEYVYGYNSDGTVTPTKVLDVINQGEKEVVDLIHNERKMLSCTLDHKFLTKTCNGKKNKGRELVSELTVRDLNNRTKIIKEYVSLEYGLKDIKTAYALGALLGDGCSRQGKDISYYISSSDPEIVYNLAEVVGSSDVTKNSDQNYTWRVGIPNRISFPFYNEWCKGRYAHEKILDWEEVKTWNRASKLKLLAGLLDTDGSIVVSERILTISIAMQAKSVIEVFSKLVKELWFYDTTILIDNRPKYKNGPVYYTIVRNNQISKLIVKELDQYLACPRKKWKDSYSELLENNSRRDCVGVKISNPHREFCYDIEVDNETHLYLVENGLVTHNSTSTLVAELEICIQNDYAIVKHACPTQKMVKEMIYPALRVIFHDAPPEFNLDKLWSISEGKLTFPNGSMLTIAGTDGNNADNLRGAYAHFVTADEGGFMDNLDYVIKSILLPQTDTTNGKLAILSTPNFYNPNHEFHTEYVFPYEASDKLVKFTIYDSPMVNDKEREKIIARFKRGSDDPKFRCEYMVEVPRSTETSVVPEFYENRSSIIFNDDTEDAPRIPEFCDFYVSGDIGVKDLTIYLFGYYNFLTAELVILDEWLMNGMELTSLAIAEGIKSKETLRFVNPFSDQVVPPYRRVMDNDLKLINDLKLLHGLNFRATKKDNKRAAVNALRVFIQEGRLKIHSRCKHLIYHVQNAQWKEKNGPAEFEQLEDSIDGEIKGGHADGLDALIYLRRNLDEKHNPYPYSPTTYTENQHISTQGREENENKHTKKGLLMTMFGRKK